MRIEKTNFDRFPPLTEEEIKSCQNQDVIITRYKNMTEVEEDGSMRSYRKEKKINVTKMVNEQKKLLKTETAAQKITELLNAVNKE